MAFVVKVVSAFLKVSKLKMGFPFGQRQLEKLSTFSVVSDQCQPGDLLMYLKSRLLFS